MYKATRELIKARQKNAKHLIESVNVLNIGGGKFNDCFNNATNLNEKDKRYKVVSGWIVGPYDHNCGGSGIISHFWNSFEGKHVDSTPGITSEYQYVVDVDLLIYGQEHFDELDELVCSSLWLENGKFHLVEMTDDDLFFTGEAKNLSAEKLFQRCRSIDSITREKMEFLRRLAA